MRRSLWCLFMILALFLTACSAPMETAGTTETTTPEGEGNPEPPTDSGNTGECEHVLSDPTCTMPARCTLCKRPFGTSLGHDWKNGECTVCKREDTMARKKEGVLRVVCVGDSITRGEYWANNFGERLSAEDYEVMGCGVNGATGLKAGLDGSVPEPRGYLITEEYKLSLRYNPDIVVIMLGTNDSKGMNADRIREDGGEQYKKDMIELIDSYKALEADPQIFLALPATIYRDPGTGKGINDPALVELIIPLLLQVAEETGVILIDVHTPTQDCSALFPDGVHPSLDGKALLAQIVSDAILENAETEE